MNSGQRERSERRLAAILAADVAGYSRLMSGRGGHARGADGAAPECDGPEDPRASRAHRQDNRRRAAGRVASVVDAVRWAVEVQREMALRGAAVPAERRIEFRIGINLGDIIIEEDDIYGDGVHCWLEHTRSRLKLKRRSLCWARPYRSELNRHKGQLLLRRDTP
jgi:adenylate cyclase